MTTRPVPYGGPATPVGYFARGPGDLPLSPATRSPESSPRSAPRSPSTPSRPCCLTSSPQRGMRAHYPQVTLYAWVAAARARTRGRRPSLRGAARVRGQGHGTLTNSWTTCSTTCGARQRCGMTRAAPRHRTPANPHNEGRVHERDGRESMRLAAATPGTATERSPTGIGAEADRYAYESDRPGAKTLGEHPGMGIEV
jgi:hypothetical protein